MLSVNQNQFLTTHWSLVVSAAADARQALEELCSQYWSPLYHHVRRIGYDANDAQDITQAFFANLLEKDLLGFADKSKGRFRTFLLTAMRRFIINQWKRDQAQKRGGGRKILSLDFETAESGAPFEPSCDITADQLFDRQWAVTLLENAVTRLTKQYHTDGKDDWLNAMLPYVIASLDRMDAANLGDKLQMSTGAVKMAATRIRKQLAEAIRAEIRQTVATADEVDDELRRLFGAFRAS